MGVGHDQILYLNRGGTGGMVMIVDYAGAAPTVAYARSWSDGASSAGST